MGLPLQVKEQEWEEWLRNPVTRAFRNCLRAQVEQAMRAWADGCFTTDTQAGTVQLNANALGRVQAVEGVLELDLEQLNESSEEAAR